MSEGKKEKSLSELYREFKKEPIDTGVKFGGNSKVPVHKEYVQNPYKFHEDRQKYIENGYTFKSTETTSSGIIELYLKDKTKRIFYTDGAKTDMYFIYYNALKREFYKNWDNVLNSKINSDPRKIDYFYFDGKIRDYTPFEPGVIHNYINVYDLDLSAAYYYTALFLGFISEKTCNDIVKNLVKADRLTLMGALASVKHVRHYSCGEQTHKETIKDEFLRMAWFKICSYVDGTMKLIQRELNKEFLFYWVDATA